MNDDTMKAQLLCVADSNWVLGHWYTVCMLNGRELTDFTSMAGIAEDKLGHTRAPEYQLEFGRAVDQVHNMELLDAPPQGWADFILTLYLADVAIWQVENAVRDTDVAPVKNLLTKFGEEAYFHQLCIDGWLKALDDAERDDLKAALPGRLELALQWFDEPELKARFSELVFNKLAPIIDLSDAELAALPAGDRTSAWDALRRRPEGSAMPPRLWEAVVPTSEDALIARRPLAVSVDDNIDLFVKVRKDETEPQF
jgi:ring-1,2-phenylacetyl-CoA epoxidase subunit PaaC